MYRKIFSILFLIQVLCFGDGFAGNFHVYSSEGKCLLEMPCEILGRAFLVVSRLDSVYENRTYQSGSKRGKEVVLSFEQNEPGKVDVYLPDDRIGEAATSLGMMRLLIRDRVAFPVMSCPVQSEERGNIVIDITGMMEKGQPFFENEGKRVVRSWGEKDQFSCTVMRELPAIRRTWKRDDDKMVDMPVTTTFFLLPEHSWQEREGDRRVGFSTVSYDYFKDECTGVRTRDVIRRWALEPRDKEAYRAGKLVEPLEPIVFYLDPLIPVRWKPYFVRAVEDWQRAFEAAGFCDAIVARDIPGHAEEVLSSARGVILYQDSLRGEVVDVNVDPRSGQIIQAYVHWSPVLLDSLKCAWITRSALSSSVMKPGPLDEQVVSHLIRVTLGQRIGIALGLLPNKLATAWIPVERLRDSAWLTAHGMSSSIMGDVLLNTVAQPEDRVNVACLFPGIGLYDRWAIHWGYRYSENEYEGDGVRDALFRDNLRKPECWWYDRPFSLTVVEAVANLGNLGNDPIRSAGYALENVKRVFTKDCLFKVKYDTTAWGEWVRNAGRKEGILYEITLPVMEQFGGVETRLDSSFDYVSKLFPVGRERQEHAMEFLNREVFATPLWLTRSSLIKKTGLASTGVIIDWQSAVLEFLFEKSTDRFALNPVLFGAASDYTIDEFLDGLYRGIWFGLEKEKPETCKKALRARYLEIVDKTLKGRVRSDVSIALQVHLNRLHTMLVQILAGEVRSGDRDEWIRYKTKIEDVLK